MLLDVSRTTEKTADLFGAEDHRQHLWFLGRWNYGPKVPPLLERDLVKKTQGGHGEQDGTGGQLLLVSQMQLIGADLFRSQPLGGPAEVTCEQGDLQQVGLLRAWRQVPHL